MRLARGSGVDGLAGMAERRIGGPGAGAAIDIVRPLLGMPKARLVAWLRAEGLDWVEDPSNAAERFERVRLRHHGVELAALGLGNEALALSARRLMRARRALEAATRQLERVAVHYHDGAFARITGAILANAPEEIALRLMSRVVEIMGGQASAPPMPQVEALVARLAAAGSFTRSMAGCLVCRNLGRNSAAVDVFREPGRTGLPELTLAPGSAAIWDNRFLLRASPPSAGDSPVAFFTVRGLTAGELTQLKREHGQLPPMPRRATLTLPSAWQGDELVAVPHLAVELGPGARGRADGGFRRLEVQFLSGRPWIDGAT